MRVALRPFLTTDLPTLDAWAATGEPGSHMSRWKPRSQDSGPDRLRWCMILSDGRDAGTLWLEKENAAEDMATLGILIGDVAWRGNGIGRQAILLALDEVRDVGRTTTSG
ncbi:MAG: hypothetical protein EOP85_11830 [Verrucomicrobiaceae bacterium]|nr:MAG: hypothetical protein EOP85_11830 [Verrucomicrobiaceae bacterium]